MHKASHWAHIYCFPVFDDFFWGGWNAVYMDLHKKIRWNLLFLGCNVYFFMEVIWTFAWSKPMRSHSSSKFEKFFELVESRLISRLWPRSVTVCNSNLLPVCRVESVTDYCLLTPVHCFCLSGGVWHCWDILGAGTVPI